MTASKVCSFRPQQPGRPPLAFHKVSRRNFARAFAGRRPFLVCPALSSGPRVSTWATTFEALRGRVSMPYFRGPYFLNSLGTVRSEQLALVWRKPVQLCRRQARRWHEPCLSPSCDPGATRLLLIVLRTSIVAKKRSSLGGLRFRGRLIEPSWARRGAWGNQATILQLHIIPQYNYF